MCKTTTPPRPAAQDAIRKLQPNNAAGAVIPLGAYLDKYWAKFYDELVPSTPPTLPPDVDPQAYQRVAISIWPLLGNAMSSYYAGIFDDDTDFSASLVKVAALYAAGQLLAEAKDAFPGSTLATLNAELKTEILANADERIRTAAFPKTSPVQLLPNTTASILDVTGPTPKFIQTFNNDLSLMIVQSDDDAAARVIDALGYGYISAVLNEGTFFERNDAQKGVGIWLAGDYSTHFYKPIPCVNDHPDAQLTTSRQMCRLFAMIRLKQLPTRATGVDLDTNALMQRLLQEPKVNGTQPWLLPGRQGGPSVDPWFSIVHDKIGFDGLGTIRKPIVYSEGLIIRWTDASQTLDFNKKIDPDNANPSIRLSGEFAVCWQNLLAVVLSTGFDGIVDVLNNTISDFLDQKSL